MPLSSSLVAKLETPTADGKRSIGTAYPIAPGYIITAYHVFPDIQDFSKTRVIWERNDDIRKGVSNPVEESIDEIVYDSEEYDVVIAACKTPEGVIGVQWCREFTELVGSWSSTGYAATGKDAQIKKRLKDPADGTFSTAQDDDWVQQLVTDATSQEVELWRGMSGAAVFLKGTDRLAAVIIETPRLDKNGKPVKDNVLYAASLPYLFNDEENDEFRRAIERVQGECGQAAYDCFREQQISAIGSLLSSLNTEGKLYQLLLVLAGNKGLKVDSEVLCKALFTRAEAAPLSFLKQLREEVVTPLLSDITHDFLNAKSLYLLFLGLLLSSEHFVFSGSIHDLQAKTRMAAELQLAGRYNKPPNLVRNLKAAAGSRDSVVGAHAIDGSFLKEVGWSADKGAEGVIEVVDKSIYKTYEHVHSVDTVPPLDDFDIDVLNAELSLRLGRAKHPELIRLEVDSTEEMKKTHPLHNRDVCAAIQRKLSNLIIARYGHGTMGEEANLLAETREFFNLIEGENTRAG